MGLILDSSVVITAERRGDTVERLIERVVSMAGDQDAALSAVGLTELVHGLYRAQTPEMRVRRESFLRLTVIALVILRDEASAVPPILSPAFPLFQRSDVRDVMASMPRVQSKELLQAQHTAVLRMAESAIEVRRIH